MTKKDIALVAFLGGDDGWVMAYDGEKAENGCCPFQFEVEQGSHHIHDLDIHGDFGNLQPGLYIWEGEIEYCHERWHYDMPCDCGPNLIGEVRLATAEDRKQFNFLVAD